MVPRTLTFNKREEDIVSLKDYVNNMFDENNYMKFISERLFCHPNFLKNYDFSKFDEIKKNPSGFQYFLIYLEKVHFAFLVFKNHYPFFSFGYSAKFNDIQIPNQKNRVTSKYKDQIKTLSQKNGFITIPDSLYTHVYKKYTWMCINKKSIKKKNITSIVKKTGRNFLKKFELPMIIMGSTFTKKQIGYIHTLISKNPVYSLSSDGYNHTGLLVEGNFNKLTKINLSVKKNLNKYDNCYDFAFQFLKRGRKEARDKYSKHIKSYTFQIALRNIIDLIRYS